MVDCGNASDTVAHEWACEIARNNKSSCFNSLFAEHCSS